MNANDYMAMADRALRSANSLMQDGDSDGAINRSYFAAYYAACAVVKAAGNIPPAELPEGDKEYKAAMSHLLEAFPKPLDRAKFEELDRMNHRDGTWASCEPPLPRSFAVEACNIAFTIVSRIGISLRYFVTTGPLVLPRNFFNPKEDEYQDPQRWTTP